MIKIKKLHNSCWCGSHEVTFDNVTKRWHCMRCQRSVSNRLPTPYNKGQSTK